MGIWRWVTGMDFEKDICSENSRHKTNIEIRQHHKIILTNLQSILTLRQDNNLLQLLALSVRHGQHNRPTTKPNNKKSLQIH